MSDIWRRIRNVLLGDKKRSENKKNKLLSGKRMSFSVTFKKLSCSEK